MKVLAALILTASFSALGESEIINLSINKADQLLKNRSWTPIPFECEYEKDKESHWSFSDAPNIYKSGITSVHSCSGTGQNDCNYFYKDNEGKCLLVVTVGEFAFKGLESLVVKTVRTQCPDVC